MPREPNRDTGPHRDNRNNRVVNFWESKQIVAARNYIKKNKRFIVFTILLFALQISILIGNYHILKNTRRLEKHIKEIENRTVNIEEGINSVQRKLDNMDSRPPEGGNGGVPPNPPGKSPPSNQDDVNDLTPGGKPIKSQNQLVIGLRDNVQIPLRDWCIENNLGNPFKDDPPKGRFGPFTEKAIKLFQENQGLESNGELDYCTYTTIRAVTGKGKPIEAVCE